MSNLEQINMTNVICNIPTHQAKVIEGLCLSSQCKENPTLCPKCFINSHPQCRELIKDIDVIPKQLMDLQQLSFDILILQESINQLFKELLSKIQQILLPISQYKTTPNFTNLNQIGLLLRTNPNQTIVNLIHATKTQIQFLLDNQNIKPKQQAQVKEQIQEKPKIQESPQKQNAQEFYRKGLSLYKQSKYSEAIDCIDQAIKIDPKHIDSWYLKGLSLYKQSKYSEAIDCIDQAIKIDPKHIDSWYLKGLSLYKQSKYSEAIDCIDQAIKIDPKHIDSWYLKGLSLYNQRKYNEAIDCFDQAIKIDPKHINSWYFKGLSLYKQSKYSEAIDCFDQAIKINPKHIDYWYFKGLSLSELGKYVEAIECFEECNNIFPDYASNQLWDVQLALKNQKKR